MSTLLEAVIADEPMLCDEYPSVQCDYGSPPDGGTSALRLWKIDQPVDFRSWRSDRHVTSMMRCGDN